MKDQKGRGRYYRTQCAMRASCRPAFEMDFEAGTVKKSNRRFVVFTSIVGVLTLTSALLLALAPAPLMPDSTTNLFAMEPPETLDVIFNTPTPVQNTRWKYIYVHHSRTSGGDAVTVNSRGHTGMGDHFLIGNGEGAI